VHLVILTQYYRPETGAPQNRLGDLATRARHAGHEVTVVTAMPNYPSGTVRPEHRGRLTSEEDIDGVRVLRSWIHGHRGRGTTHQLATYASFAGTSLLSAPLRVRSADVLLWESPPLFLAPTAELLARRIGARLVMNVSDLWPESAVELGMLRDRRLVALFTALARRAYNRADLVLGQTEGILIGIDAVAPGTPTLLFPNGVELGSFRPQPRDEALATELALPPGHLVLGYAGNFGRAQALPQVTDAARRLLRERDDVVVLLVGDGPVKDHVLADASDLDPRRFLVRTSVEASRMPALLSLFDIAVVPLADQPLFEGARPSKMFELLAAGVPFVYCGRGEGAALAGASGSASVVPPEDPGALAAAAGALLSLPAAARAALGEVGRAWVAATYGREAIGVAVIDRLEEICRQTPQPPKARRRHVRTRSDVRPSP